MNENPFGALTREAVPDSRLDVAHVVTRGRARARRRRNLTAVTATVLVGALVGMAVFAQVRSRPKPDPVSPVPMPVPCAPAPLGSLESSNLVEVDDSGRYLVGTPNEADGVVFLTDPSGTRALTTLPRLRAVGVNASGTIIGNVDNDTDADGYVITADVTRPLGRPPGALNVTASAINDAGDVAGDARMPGGKIRAVVWRQGKWDQPQLLPIPSGAQAGEYSTGSGIDADGRIVGSIGIEPQPYLWQADGTGRILPALSGRPGAVAAGIAGDWVHGAVDLLAGSTFRPNGRRVSSGEVRWARWNLRTGAVREVQVGQPSNGATGLLTDGTVVVNVSDGTVLWNDTGITKVPVPAGLSGIQVTDATGGGLLVGTAFSSSGEPNPFRWQCR